MGKSPDAKSRPDTQERPGPPMRKVFKKHLSIIKSNIDDIADYQEEVNQCKDLTQKLDLFSKAKLNEVPGLQK